jgi:flagellar biosynthesis/type III secretory pathway protein FliH
MTDRIKCTYCGAESFNDENTLLYCQTCYDEAFENGLKQGRNEGYSKGFYEGQCCGYKED